MMEFLTECDQLARTLASRPQAAHEREAVPDVRRALAVAGCMGVLTLAAAVLS